MSRYVELAYVAWLAAWFLAAFNTKRTARRESRTGRLIITLLSAASIWLLFLPAFRSGFLGTRFVPDFPWIGYLGFAITLAGLGFSLWARAILGRNWSGTITIKEDHQLIRRGPYRFVRHPIYSGILLAMLATAAVYGTVSGLVGFGLAFFTLWRKSRIEERFMTEQFGAEYQNYRQEVKALIPRVF